MKKKLTLLFALLCASMMSFAIDWSGIDWLTNSNEKYKLSISPNFGDEFGGKRVEGTNLWIGFPSAAFGAMSIEQSGGAGAWKTFALSNFPNQENQFTVECGGTTYTFDVYYVDGSTKSNPALTLNSTAETLDATTPETFQIVPTQSGDGAISYESSNSGIASVDNTGLVTAVGRGTATITVSTAETATYAAASKTLTVTVTGPINWSGIDWLAGSSDKYKLSISPEISDTYGGKHVQGTDLWIGFPSAAFGAMSITPSDGAGAWKTFALSNFPNQENQFTVECGGTTYTFDVYYADGTSGGGDPEPTEVYDTNFALVSLGASATSDNGGTANNAIDNNDGSSWESTHGIDAVKLTIDLGQKRIFNTVQIRWEGAYGKAFTIDVSNDGSDWTTVKSVDETLSGFPYEQNLEFAKTTARYIRFNGIERGTQWGYNMFSFRVLLPGVSVLTSIDLTADAAIGQVGGAGVALTVVTKDQNGQAMAESVSYEITPAAAGHMSGNTFIPDQVGSASIRAYNGSVYSDAVTINAYTGTNVALNKGDADITVSGYDDVHNLYPRFAVDADEGSLWSARVGETGAERAYDAWISVDLGAYYDINLIAIRWEGACSRHYHVDFSTDGSAWRTAYNAGWNATATHWEYLNGTAEDNTKVRYIRVWSTEAVSQYGVKIMVLQVYGTEWVNSGDDEKPVMGTAELTSNTYEQAVIAVTATDNEEVARYHVIDALHSIDVNCTPAAGNITVAGLTHNTIYNFTITAIDASGNESDNNVVLPVSIPFNTTINLALNQPCEAGYENTNPAESRDKANDGNDGTNWNTYADRPASEEWWYVDLGNLYTLTNITAIWGDVYSTNYILQARVAAPSAADKADDAAWVTLATITDAAANATKSTNVSGVGRYVRIHSLAKSSNFFRLRELEVYGSGVAEADAEAPVMTSASLVSNTDAQAVIAVAATDNQGIANYHVIDAGNILDGNFVAEAGQITVTGLTGGTNYTLVITAVDYFGNESANNKSVAVTTTAHYTEPQAACPAPTWDASLVKAIYSPTYSADCGFDAWGSGSTAADDTYGKKYTIGPNGGEGGYFGMVDFTLNCLLMEKLHFDIWVADDMTIRFVPIWGGAEQGITKSLLGQQWNSIDIDLTEYTGITNWSNITQMKLDHLTKNVDIWIANAYFYREAAYVDNVAPMNASASKVAEGFYSVQISAQAEDNSGAVSFVVKNGDVEVATGASASGVATTITVNNLTPGTAYNFDVIVSDEAGNALDPIAISATTKALPAAATTPDFSGKLVIPVFTDAMACAVSGIQSGGWGETTQVEWLDIAEGDKVFYGQNFNFAGWHSWGGGNIDATGMQFLHVDIYSTGMTAVNVTPISPGHEGSATISLTPNAWTSYDVPLSAYDANNIDWANIFQFKFMGPVGGNELMIDNVYFWKNPDMVRDDSWMAPGELGTVCIPQGAVATGGDLYTLEGKNSDGKIVFATVPNNEMQPGVPYLFQATSNAMNFFYTDATPATEPDNSGAMQGTFSDQNLTELDNVYYFAGHALWSCSDLTSLEVKANRAWVDMSKVGSGANPAPGRRYIIMDVHGQNATTGFGEVQGDDVYTKVLIDGQLFILRGEKMYNANGQLVK